MTNVALPLPRITVVGDEFRRLGERWIGWGFGQLDGDFKADFMASTDMDDFLHNTMADTFSGDHAQGANAIRFKWELWDILDVTSTDEDNLIVNETGMANLMFAIDSARKNNMYILLSGCRQTKIGAGTMPSWYDDNFGDSDPKDRWDVQEFAHKEVAKRIVASKNSTTILGYELCNEPTISSDSTFPWYGNAWAGSTDPAYFTTTVARGETGATAMATAVTWMTQLSTAIKSIDPKALITIGALPYAQANQPFGVANMEIVLDWLSPHLYPTTQATLPLTAPAQLLEVDRWAPTSFTDGLSTKPVLVGEMSPWSTTAINNTFWDRVEEKLTNGVLSFSWGYGADAFAPLNYVPFQYPGPVSTPTNSEPLVGNAWWQRALTYGRLVWFATKRASYLNPP